LIGATATIPTGRQRHLIGGFGNDSLWGEGGNDQLFGEAAPTVDGRRRQRRLIGGDGNDSLWGQAATTVWGCAGNDYLDGGADMDFAWGGTAPTPSTTCGTRQRHLLLRFYSPSRVSTRKTSASGLLRCGGDYLY